MKLTNISELLISFFNNGKNKCLKLKHKELNKKTENIFKNFFNEIHKASEIVKNLKININTIVKVKEITNYKDIPKPTTFASQGFPSNIRKYIDENMVKEIEYNIDFTIINRKIKIYFLLELEEDRTKFDINVYNNYINNILIWLTIIDEYASKECAPNLTIFIYLTNLKKEIPLSNISVLNENNANTAFTMTCPKNSEIVIYRKEEWFKVLLHETFHNLGLDFSDMNNEKCKQYILNIFPVNSEVNLYEAYAEFWAKLMNIIFCSFLHLKDKNDEEEFLTNCEFFINFEIIYSCFQMIKVLDFMNLNYKQLYLKGQNNDLARNTFYKEKTNILAYYVITFILLDNYDKFIEWCDINNLSLLQFKKTTMNQVNLCKFISQKYRSKSLLDDIRCVELFYNKIKSKFKNKKTLEIDYVLNNMRMTLCELG
jgi:hypothetical protein